ncbi:MAG TPA: NAD(P)-dependent oxidoreductase, partial [Nitrospiraceae bacterium]|nr:NAD(P)-dependent oxidoreductase [Nitrospiraceae bacterium]
GITIADSPEDAIRAVSCVILILADAPAIHAVLLNPGARHALAGRTVIQMGTIGPEESRTLRDHVVAAGGDYFEAPVLGSIAEAKGGGLLVMIGAEPNQFTRWVDTLRCLGPEPRLIGPVGSAAALKLSLNHLIAAQIVAFSLSLGLVQREDVPVDSFMSVLRDSALYAATFDKKLPRLVNRDYAKPNFPVKHLLKDVDLVLKEAGSVGLNASGLAGVRALLQETMQQGFEDVDYSAVFEAIVPRPAPH